MIAAAASVHGATAFEVAVPASQAGFAEAGGALGAVAALTREVITAGGLRQDSGWAREATEELLQVCGV